MYLLGHSGITVGAVRASGRRVDLRLAALLALGPDLIDKPILLLFPALVNGNGRNFGHSGLGALTVLALLLLFRRRARRPILLWACYAGHLLLDRMWQYDNPIVVCWPLLGGFPPQIPPGPEADRVFHYDVAGELLGFAAWARLAWRNRLFDRPALRAFLRSGDLPQA